MRGYWSANMEKEVRLYIAAASSLATSVYASLPTATAKLITLRKNVNISEYPLFSRLLELASVSPPEVVDHRVADKRYNIGDHVGH
jgi:hypothetical protein